MGAPSRYSRWGSLRVFSFHLAEVQAAAFAAISGVFALWALLAWPPSMANLSVWIVGVMLWWSLQRWIAAGKHEAFEPDLTGKIAIVTGGDTSIGKEIVRRLARMGARVFIACRDPEKSTNAALQVNKDIGVDRVEFLQLDLADMASVRRFAATFIGHNLPLHLLVNNAGLLHAPFTLIKDGFELQYATNHLGHYLLTRLLLPIIERSAGRIVMASSIGHMLAPSGIPFEDLTNEKVWQTDVWYGYAKLANILFVRELQRRLEQRGSRATVYSYHPGIVQTEGRKQFPKWFQYGSLPIQWLTYKATWQGAETPVFCCVDPTARPGEYHAECRVVPTTPVAHDMELAAKVWTRSALMVGIDDEETQVWKKDENILGAPKLERPAAIATFQTGEQFAS